MMYGGWGGWGPMMLLMSMLWIVLIGLVVWAAIQLGQRSSNATRAQPLRETPQEILDRRFASGEIDADAYRQARDALTGADPRK